MRICVIKAKEISINFNRTYFTWVPRIWHYIPTEYDPRRGIYWLGSALFLRKKAPPE